MRYKLTHSIPYVLENIGYFYYDCVWNIYVLILLISFAFIFKRKSLKMLSYYE
jgi:hypothetical protein